MRKLFTCSLLLCASLYMYAQNCTTTWPYIYSDFSEGKIYYRSGSVETKFMNIHILENKLHYVDGENINELTSARNIAKVEIIKESYIPFGGKFYQVVSEGSSGGYLTLIITGDFASLLENTGAYGSSSNSTASTNLSSIDIMIVGRRTDNLSHMNLRNNKSGGRTIPLVKKYFFITNGDVIPAIAKEVEKSFPTAEKKKAFKNFVKANKINWNKPEDLAKLLAVL